MTNKDEVIELDLSDKEFHLVEQYATHKGISTDTAATQLLKEQLKRVTRDPGKDENGDHSESIP